LALGSTNLLQLECTAPVVAVVICQRCATLSATVRTTKLGAWLDVGKALELLWSDVGLDGVTGLHLCACWLRSLLFLLRLATTRAIKFHVEVAAGCYAVTC
jgi:hypothetical protein